MIDRKLSTLFVLALFTAAVLLAAPSADAQIQARAGLVAPGAQAPSANTEPEGTSLRPAPVTPPQVGKEAAFGNLRIVIFEEDPLVSYVGDLPGLAATSPLALGPGNFDPKSTASQSYLSYLDRRHERHLTRIEDLLGRPVDAVFRYRAGMNGMALKITAAEGKKLESLPGVVRVIPDRARPLHTDAGPPWIEADGVWDGSGTGGAGTATGEGTIVAILDTGINSSHESFAATDGLGYTHTNPNGSGVFMGWCDPANPDFDPTFPCNDKLIGAWDYSDAYCAANPGDCAEDDGPEDDPANGGHGSHTASTVAGNILDLTGDGIRDLSGVAPRANIIAYDVCAWFTRENNNLCPDSTTSAAADQAILDGVDALNFSIGGGSSPWLDATEMVFLQATAAGVFVAASAGNSGPGAGTVAHLGPWVATVAAATHNRDVSAGVQSGVDNQLIDMTGGVSPPADIDGTSRTGGYGPAPIVYAGDYSNGDINPEQCLSPFPPGTWTNQIVVCDRGSIARVMKCQNVADGGAAGCVLANINNPSQETSSDAHIIPAVHINSDDGDAVRAWLASGTGHTATITAGVLDTDDTQGDIMADFSSRGPNNSFDVLKPDILAPGVLVFAAVQDGAVDEVGLPPFQGNEFSLLSGTSMSSPHIAGSGALLRSLHSSWTAGQIKSALMMTAHYATVLKEDGSTPADHWDMGAGRASLEAASQAGLVMDETLANYMAADPALGGDASTLNIASLKQSACVITCTFSRTFQSVVPVLGSPGGDTVTWTVTSESNDGVTVSADPIMLQSGQQATVEFTASTVGVNPGDPPVFGRVLMTPNDGGPVLQMPVVLTITENNFPDLFTISTLEESGTEPVEGLRYFEALTNATYDVFGFAQGTATDVVLDEDPTNSDPYDDLGQVFWKTVSVPAGSQFLLAATESAEAPDVDLFVGSGGMPSSGTQLCSSTTPTADEFCQIDSPAAGTYWILVQNWQGSDSQPDLIKLVDGVVPDSGNGSLTVIGPNVLPAGFTFDLQVSWDLSGLSAPDVLEPDELFFGAYRVVEDGLPIKTTLVVLTLEGSLFFSDGFESGDTSAWSVTVQP